MTINNPQAASVSLCSSSTYNFDPYGLPYLLYHYITEDQIEFIYRRDSTITYTSSFDGVNQFNNSNPPIIYKDIYKVVDGKIKKVETVIGEYIPASPESYKF